MNYMTKKTRDRLLKRLQEIKRERLQLINELSCAAEHGDLRENSEFDAAMEKQGMLNREADVIIKRLEKTILIEDLRVDGSRVSIGTVTRLTDGVEEIRIIILGCPEDTVDEEGIVVTYLSSIARSLIGKKEGDTATIKLNSKFVEMEITDITPIFNKM